MVDLATQTLLLSRQTIIFLMNNKPKGNGTSGTSDQPSILFSDRNGKAKETNGSHKTSMK
jgi:hypothetical protein